MKNVFPNSSAHSGWSLLEPARSSIRPVRAQSHTPKLPKGPTQAGNRSFCRKND
jgi:hypothetical protein